MTSEGIGMKQSRHWYSSHRKSKKHKTNGRYRMMNEKLNKATDEIKCEDKNTNVVESKCN